MTGHHRWQDVRDDADVLSGRTPEEIAAARAAAQANLEAEIEHAEREGARLKPG